MCLFTMLEPKTMCGRPKVLHSLPRIIECKEQGARSTEATLKSQILILQSLTVSHSHCLQVDSDNFHPASELPFSSASRCHAFLLWVSDGQFAGSNVQEEAV